MSSLLLLVLRERTGDKLDNQLLQSGKRIYQIDNHRTVQALEDNFCKWHKRQLLLLNYGKTMFSDMASQPVYLTPKAGEELRYGLIMIMMEYLTCLLQIYGEQTTLTLDNRWHIHYTNGTYIGTIARTFDGVVSRYGSISSINPVNFKINPQIRNVLFQNSGNGTFIDDTESAGLDQDIGNARSAVFADFDTDSQ